MCVFGNHTDTGGPHLLPLTTPFTTCLGVTASEPYDDDPSWVDIPDRRLVRVRDGKVEIEGL
ncbi:hypothetical protein B9M85_02315 [Mycobacteroides abscessus]|nr:hypothetical protein B9M85_02315 [Mycobacteroides abscessus]